MTASVWDPEQYQRFRSERGRAFSDLLGLVQRREQMRVVDLGCGSGALTRALHRALGASETVGVDSSETMLAGSDEHAGDGVRFALADLSEFDDGAPYDLVFSNAAVHWVPDHARVLARFAALLVDGGQLAIQVPANHDYPSHTIMNEVAREPRFAEVLGGYVKPNHVLPPEEYAHLLDRLGFDDQHVRLQVYAHRLGSRDEVVEWVKGTTLTDYQKRLPVDVFAAFVERYRERLHAALPDERPFFYPFTRIHLWGIRQQSHAA